MGPVRRGVILATLLPTAALAEVCDKERPDWHLDHGPATGLDELLFLATSLPGLGVLGALTLAMMTGQRLYWGLTAFFATLIAVALWAEQTSDPSGVRALAIAEGCVGPQTLPITACVVTAVFSAIMLLRARPQTRPQA